MHFLFFLCGAVGIHWLFKFFHSVLNLILFCFFPLKFIHLSYRSKSHAFSFSLCIMYCFSLFLGALEGVFLRFYVFFYHHTSNYWWFFFFSPLSIRGLFLLLLLLKLCRTHCFLHPQLHPSHLLVLRRSKLSISILTPVQNVNLGHIFESDLCGSKFHIGFSTPVVVNTHSVGHVATPPNHLDAWITISSNQAPSRNQDL